MVFVEVCGEKYINVGLGREDVTVYPVNCWH